jgi:hypothetical protein
MAAMTLTMALQINARKLAMTMIPTRTRLCVRVYTLPYLLLADPKKISPKYRYIRND